MALILLGKSLCPLCGRLLLEGESIAGLTAIANTMHPLYAYFDAGFHQECFEQWQHAEAAREVVRLERQRFEASCLHQQPVPQAKTPEKRTRT